MIKVEDWATRTVHDHKTEHWRVTALLAKDAHGLMQAIIDDRKYEESLPKEIQIRIGVLRRSLELTDYFLSGLGERE